MACQLSKSAIINTLFKKENMGWKAYTAGGAAPSNPGPCAWGAVIIEPENTTVHRFNGYIGRGTNQISDITAAIEGRSRVPEGAQVELISDSQYVLKGLSEWRAGWEKRGFRNAKKEVVANLELWKKLNEDADKRTNTDRRVRGHAGDHFNEQADVLVGQALAAARSSKAA